MTYQTSRRRFLASTIGLSAADAVLPTISAAQDASPSTPTQQPSRQVIVSVDAEREGYLPFKRESFGIVGVYDVDWLVRPEFSVLLDNLAASPGAFHGVRFFGAFTAGRAELFMPESGGEVWTNPDGPIDFRVTFDALEALTSRGLIPFVALGFFPPAISDSPMQPPRGWIRYRKLVRTFFQQLADDPRFGPDAIANWWFEAWNEPNEGRFWTGSVEEYFELYRVTSEAIAETGLAVRLGGPAIAYKPQASPRDGAPWMERFFHFIASDPALQLDFVSLHRKGTVAGDPPDPRRMYEAAVTTAEQMLAIAPERFSGMTIINNEADEKVGFEVPYAPRMDERNAAWLATVAAIHAGLDAEYEESGITFFGAADNANLQLVEDPFDGRRSIMTLARDSRTDLNKLSPYAFYEMLPLLADRHAETTSGADQFFPETDFYHLATFADTHVGCLLASYPHPDQDSKTSHKIDYVVSDIPWDRVNVARFQIDRLLSNAYAVAGGSEDDPFPKPDPSDLKLIRDAQELALARPIDRNVELTDGVYRESLVIEPYTTMILWITPVDEATPDAPEWMSADIQDGNVVVQWEPSPDPHFYSYEVFLMLDGESLERASPALSPESLRSARWVDTSPPAGARTYGVRTVNASGAASPIVASETIVIEA